MYDNAITESNLTDYVPPDLPENVFGLKVLPSTTISGGVYDDYGHVAIYWIAGRAMVMRSFLPDLDSFESIEEEVKRSLMEHGGVSRSSLQKRMAEHFQNPENTLPGMIVEDIDLLKELIKRRDDFHCVMQVAKEEYIRELDQATHPMEDTPYRFSLVPNGTNTHNCVTWAVAMLDEALEPPLDNCNGRLSRFIRTLLRRRDYRWTDERRRRHVLTEEC